MKKRILSITLSLAMAITLILPVNAVSAAGLKSMSGEHGKGKIVLDLDLDANQESNTFTSYKKSGADISASSYSLVGLGADTAVKDQGNYNTCWAFAAAASIESNAIKRGLATATSIDVSEYALGYYVYQNPTACPEGLEGDYTETIGGWYNLGGNSFYVMNTLTRGYSIVSESFAPYSDLTKVLSDTATYFENQLLQVEDIYYIDGTSSNRDLIKDCLVTNGAVTMGVCMKDNAPYFNSATNALYVDTYNTSNELDHDITVVGWDDNYPASNFATTPAGDGAWLCKNSWGSSWGNSGYFWLSYYDAPSHHDYAFSYVVTKRSNKELIYQHDGTSIAAYERNVKKAANVFTATKDTYLNYVTFQCFTGGVTAKVDVYLGKPSADPTSGTLIGSSTVYLENGGMVTLPISCTKAIKQGKTFTVVVSFSKGVEFGVDCSSSSTGVVYTNTCHSGQSYLIHGDGYWVDCGSEENVRIKAMGMETEAEEEVLGNITAKASIAGTGKIKLSWEAVSEATGYTIYYKKSSASDFAALTVTGDQTSYTFTGLTVGATYKFKVVPFSESGLGTGSVISKLCRVATPTIKSISNKKASQVKITWGTVSKTNKYKVYRATSKNGSYKLIATVGNVTSYTDKTVKKGKTYYYKVVAVSSNGTVSYKSAAKSIKVSK